MKVKLNKFEKDRLYNISSQLRLTTAWEDNIRNISDLLKQHAPDMVLAVYWTQTGQAIYFSEESQQHFESYLQSLKRGDIVQSSTLLEMEHLERCYTQSLKLESHFLGQLYVILKNDELTPFMAQHIIDLIASQLQLARYATEMAEEVEKRTSTDKLTGLWKRTYFNERFREETERLSRSKEIGCVAVMGLDDLAGMRRMIPAEEHDAFLATVGKTLSSLLRQTDWVVRWDEYEILFYFPNTSPESSLDVFARCMNALLQINPILQSVVGLCSTSETTSARGLIQLAARRLDLARKDGRHKLVCFASRAAGLKFWEYNNSD